jgi:hypothetical protein
MAQQVINYPSPRSLYAENKILFVTTGAEHIALEAIPSTGYSKFAITISNSALSADPITIVNVYGSEDKNNYYIYKSNIFSGGIGPGATMHYEFVAMTKYFRVTIQTSGTATLDIFLIGNMGGGIGTSTDIEATPGTPGSGTVQCGIIQFVNTDVGNVTLSLPYTDTNYAITLTAGDYVVAVYDETSKTGSGFTVYVSCPFTGEVSYEVAHP